MVTVKNLETREKLKGRKTTYRTSLSTHRLPRLCEFRLSSRVFLFTQRKWDPAVRTLYPAFSHVAMYKVSLLQKFELRVDWDHISLDIAPSVRLARSQPSVGGCGVSTCVTLCARTNVWAASFCWTLRLPATVNQARGTALFRHHVQSSMSWWWIPKSVDAGSEYS